MQKVIFVMGATAAGKTHFINTHYSDLDVDILNVYDYQQRAYDEAGFGEAVPVHAQFRCLMNANNMLLADIVEKVRWWNRPFSRQNGVSLISMKLEKRQMLSLKYM